MGFPFHVAPEIQLHAGSRGIRAAFAPLSPVSDGTAATPDTRLTAFLTAVLGDVRRRPTLRLANSGHPAAGATKEETAKHLQAVFDEIISLHRIEFPDITPPAPPAIPPVEHAEMLRRHERLALTGISWLARAERRAAREQARLSANAEATAWIANAEQERSHLQRELDQQWTDLLRNDPATVLRTLSYSFKNNETPAAPTGIRGSEIFLALQAPGPEAIPERIPDTTQAGNLTLRKLNKTDRASYHRLLVSGQVLATLREVFATAPRISLARVAILRPVRTDAHGPRLDCVLAGGFPRAAFQGMSWNDMDAAAVLSETASELLANPAPRTGELRAIDLRAEPDLAGLVADVILE